MDRPTSTRSLEHSPISFSYDKKTFGVWNHFPVLVIALIFLSFSNSFGQTSTADVLGTVTDSTGATLPNATVTLVNKDTNDTRPPLSSS